MEVDRSPYAALGVAPDATFEEIRRAYRAAIRAVHPDVAPGREAEAKRLTAAYAVLADPDRRAEHDRSRAPLDDEPFLRIRRVAVVWDVS
jgi:molecular chaperone DnaJ